MMAFGTAMMICGEFLALIAWVWLMIKHDAKLAAWERRTWKRLRRRAYLRVRRLKMRLCAALARDGVYATWGARR